MQISKKNLLLLLALSICSISLTLFCLHPRKEQIHEISTKDFPTAGKLNAPIHLIIFEEFACPQCARFHLEDLPVLIQTYVEKGVVKFTSIPTAYLDSSLNGFAAAYSVMNQNIEHYQTFLNFFFSEANPFMSTRELLSLYSNIQPNFDIDAAWEILKNRHSLPLVEQIRSIVDEIYRTDIEMPTILINGKHLKNISLESICRAIDKELRDV